MLNNAQQKAVQHSTGPLLILAGAGAGKTHTLTERVAQMIEFGGVSPRSILALTFTNKAAKEMRERMSKRLKFEHQSGHPFLQSELPIIGTFHSIGVFFLRRYIERLGVYTASFSIFDEDDKQRLIRSIMEDLKIDTKQMPPRQVMYQIGEAKNTWIDARTFKATSDNYARALVGDIYNQYENRMLAMNAIDFDDILIKWRELLAYPDVLAVFHDRFTHIMVDEYQDTNNIQYDIVHKLAAKHRNIAVVGDDWQGIYSWRGANVGNILSFQKDYPDATVVKLEQNYRSTKTIIAAANAVIKNNKTALEKTLWTDNVVGEKIVLEVANDEKTEAQKIASIISAHEGEYEDWAILYRTNGQSRLLEEALLRSSIPYKIYGWVKFYERKEIKDILSYLRLIANPSDEVSLGRILNVPSRKIGDKSQEKALDYLRSQFITLDTLTEDMVPAMGLPALANHGMISFIANYRLLYSLSHESGVEDVVIQLIKAIKYEDFLKEEYGEEGAEARMDNLRELANLSSRYTGLSPRESLQAFLEDIALITDHDTDEVGSSVVSLMTVHSSKWLEFRNVIIVGLEEWLFPHTRSLVDPQALEEERRLMYVALTRAKEQLYLFAASERYNFGSYSANPLSRFAKEIPEEFREEVHAKQDIFGQKWVKLAFGSFGVDVNSFLSTAKARSKNDVSVFHVGIRVEHAQFGGGVIISWSSPIAEIAFGGGHGIRKLNLEMAPVKKVW